MSSAVLTRDAIDTPWPHSGAECIPDDTKPVEFARLVEKIEALLVTKGVA